MSQPKARKPAPYPPHFRFPAYEPLDQTWDKVEEAEAEAAEWIERGHSFDATPRGK